MVIEKGLVLQDQLGKRAWLSRQGCRVVQLYVRVGGLKDDGVACRPRTTAGRKARASSVRRQRNRLTLRKQQVLNQALQKSATRAKEYQEEMAGEQGFESSPVRPIVAPGGPRDRVRPRPPPRRLLQCCCRSRPSRRCCDRLYRRVVVRHDDKAAHSRHAALKGPAVRHPFPEVLRRGPDHPCPLPGTQLLGSPSPP